MHGKPLKRYSHARFKTQDQIAVENMQRLQLFCITNANTLVIIMLYEQWRHIFGSREETSAMSVYFRNECMFSTVI